MPLYNPVTTASPLNTNKVLFSLVGANMNVVTDQALTAAFTFASYVIDRIIVSNASTSLTLAAGGIYTAASKGGTAIVAAAQLYSGLTTSAKTLPLTIANTDLQTAALIFSLTVAQGGAATADIRVMGWALS